MFVSRPLLVVDDNEADLELTLAAIERAQRSNRIDVVRSGPEALHYLSAAADTDIRPALTLLDVKLPKVSGHEVLARVRSNPHVCQMPVVMLSGSDDRHDVARAYDLGANAYVVKPLGFRALVDALALTLTFWLERNTPSPVSLATSQ